MGYLLTIPGFRFLSLGDLTREQERAMACPLNPVDKVDLLQASHYGRAESGPAELVHAFAPKVAIVNNGPNSVRYPGALATLVEVLGSELWLLHEASPAGELQKIPKAHIANDGALQPHEGAGFRTRVLKGGPSWSLTNAMDLRSDTPTCTMSISFVILALEGDKGRRGALEPATRAGVQNGGRAGPWP